MAEAEDTPDKSGIPLLQDKVRASGMVVLQDMERLRDMAGRGQELVPEKVQAEVSVSASVLALVPEAALVLASVRVLVRELVPGVVLVLASVLAQEPEAV